MSFVSPALEYDTGGGPIVINMAGGLDVDDHPELEQERKDVFGGTGIRQSNNFYTEEIITLSFSFETEAIVDSVDTMMKDWVLAGNTFKYIPDQTVTGVFTTVQLIGKTFEPRRMTPGRDLWEFELVVREAIT